MPDRAVLLTRTTLTQGQFLVSRDPLAEFTTDFLCAEGIPVIREDLGDTCARRIDFRPASGQVRCRRVAGQPLPRVPHYMAGVVNLRGTVLPVVDLAALLGWAATEATPRHAIIVAQIDEQTRGFIVHSVSDIVTMDSAAVQPVPATGEGGIGEYLEGVIKIDGKMVMILALDSLREAGEALAA